MKKRAIVFLFSIFLILSVSLISAQDDDKVDKAYDCLKDKVEDKCDSLSVEEKAFTVLAIGDCKSELKDSSRNEQCWPSSGCRLKDTALSVMALSKYNQDTDDAEDWLLDQEQTPDDLIWFLEIDSDEETTCEISYNDREYDVVVKEDKKLSSSAGPCLSIDQGGYWLKIDDDCYDDNFTISCDMEFLTTLVYKKRTGSTVYVSSKTNFGASEGKTEEKVNSLCFGTGCDYEGSLWATLALSEEGYDVSPYLPYLIAMTDENEEYFPSSFLYMLTDYDDFFSQIIDLQTNDYWKIADSPYHQFYDTSLALLALQDFDASQADSAKSYLLEVQDEDGCWRTVRDTAFILYAAWPKQGGGVGPSPDYCEDFNYYCTSPLECDESNKMDLPCESSLGKVCCKEKPLEETCAIKEGDICKGDEECNGKWIAASDSTSCCSGYCEIVEIEEPECEVEGFDCRSSCYEDEEEKLYECDSTDVCCGEKTEKTSYWWIWLLIILIILVVLGIVFKDRIKSFIFKMKNKMGKGKGPARPGPGPGPRRFPPGPPISPGQRRMILPRPSSQPTQRSTQRPVPRPRPSPTRKPASKTDKELDETLKKLKEMSK